MSGEYCIPTNPSSLPSTPPPPFSFCSMILDHSELYQFTLYYKLLTTLEIQGSSKIALGNFNLRLKQAVLIHSSTGQKELPCSKGTTLEINLDK